MREMLVEVHSHLLPGVDDGCRDPEESVACARVLVGKGYTHAFCTPHVLPQFPWNTPEGIAAGVERLQKKLDHEGVRLKVLPGGELTLATAGGSPTQARRREDVVTYGLAGKWVLFDFWEDDPKVAWGKLEREVGRLLEWGFELICAHPERIGAVHRDPSLVDRLGEMGVRFQLNCWCLCEPAGSKVRELAERWLREGRYWVMGSDLHRADSMGLRVAGLRRAEELIGREAVEVMTGARGRELIDGELPPR
jgi:protein-tyrosine phosphatase